MHRRVARCALVCLTAAVLAIVTGCGEPTAGGDQPAYTPTYSVDGREVLYHWRAGSTIHVYAQPTIQSSAPDLSAAVRAAFATWGAVPEFREYRLELVDVPTTADVIVRFRSDIPRVSYADCTYPPTSALGITFFCPDQALTRVQTLALPLGGAGHVRMEVAVSSAAANFQAVVTHEIGHVLGIGAHSLDANDLMYPFPTVTVPSDRDIATLRYVLHQPSALVL